MKLREFLKTLPVVAAAPLAVVPENETMHISVTVPAELLKEEPDESESQFVFRQVIYRRDRQPDGTWGPWIKDE